MAYQTGFFTPGLGERGQAIIDRYLAQKIPVDPVSPEVMHVLSETESPQGILAVLALQPLKLPMAPNFSLILDGIRDPGNLGTMLRTAAAAGVNPVLLTPGSVDPYSPKVIRAAMGAHFHLPVHSFSWEALLAYLNNLATPLQVHLADAHAGISYLDADFCRPLALIIGGEAQGAGSQAGHLATSQIHIPMPGQIESLNAAIASAILMFEVVRQRNRSIK
jgi:TrmH family RNA methyltransferase